jgi:hypothetical protein
MTVLLWLWLQAYPTSCFELGMWLTSCPKHVLNLSLCEQQLLKLCNGF